MTILLYYLALINIVAFVVRWVDKRRAIKQQWRVPEKVLLLLAGLGGFVWAIVGMQMFRHKTIKGEFLIWFWLIVGAWIVFYTILLYQK